MAGAGQKVAAGSVLLGAQRSHRRTLLHRQPLYAGLCSGPRFAGGPAHLEAGGPAYPLPDKNNAALVAGRGKGAAKPGRRPSRGGRQWPFRGRCPAPAGQTLRGESVGRGGSRTLSVLHYAPGQRLRGRRRAGGRAVFLDLGKSVDAAVCRCPAQCLRHRPLPRIPAPLHGAAQVVPLPVERSGRRHGCGAAPGVVAVPAQIGPGGRRRRIAPGGPGGSPAGAHLPLRGGRKGLLGRVSDRLRTLWLLPLRSRFSGPSAPALAAFPHLHQNPLRRDRGAAPGLARPRPGGPPDQLHGRRCPRVQRLAAAVGRCSGVAQYRL